jgi:hypothetical protein
MGSNNRTDVVKATYYDPFMNTGKRLRNDTESRQVMLERMYMRVLGELAMNRFEWKGFPPSVNLRYLELTLYYNALSVVFKDKNTDALFALRGAPSGRRNMVDDPIAFTLTGPNFQGITLSVRKCVPIWANYFRVPDLDIVSTYAYKLSQIDRTIEINLNSARRTKVLAFNENSQLTAENINRQLERGDAAIGIDTSMGSLSDMVSALDMGVDPKSIETLSVVRGRLWSEAMGLLGINNANQDKKERLVEAEVGANNDQIENTRQVNLNARQEAADAINRMWGLNVTVDYHTDLTECAMLPEIPGTEGAEDAGLHD